MPTYAAETTVTPEKSRQEIESTLMRYGAEAFMYGWEEGRAVVQFRAKGRMIRFLITMPDREDEDFTKTPTGRDRSEKQAFNAWEQACRQRWRALALVIKAKLEAVESGITSFDSEFMAQIVLPDGSTVGQFMQPQIEVAYETGDMPKVLALERGD